MFTTSHTEQQISDLTAFDQGDVFKSEAQVRDYFTPTNMKEMFGGDWDFNENQLPAMADAVIEHRWHCEF